MDPQQSVPIFNSPPQNQGYEPGGINELQGLTGSQNTQSNINVGGAARFAIPKVATDPQQIQDQTAVNNISTPVVAQDVDLIEKEWINKVEEIVQYTKGDPYEQARQLAILKGEYQQKRYQKTLNST
jgi:hypothetical protein